MNKSLVVGIFLLFALTVFSQEDKKQTSNIQTYTPSKLLNNGQWDIKWF